MAFGKKHEENNDRYASFEKEKALIVYGNSSYKDTQELNEYLSEGWRVKSMVVINNGDDALVIIERN